MKNILQFRMFLLTHPVYYVPLALSRLADNTAATSVGRM